MTGFTAFLRRLPWWNLALTVVFAVLFVVAVWGVPALVRHMEAQSCYDRAEARFQHAVADAIILAYDGEDLTTPEGREVRNRVDSTSDQLEECPAP